MAFSGKRKKLKLTVGLKLLAGMALVSNLCIGSLLYVNWQASLQMTVTVDELLHIRDQDGANLRQTIVDLQKKLLTLPSLFDVDPSQKIQGYLTDSFPLLQSEKLTGREKYSSLFTRSERRDLQKKKPVIGQQGGTLTVSWGIFDKNGSFTEAVERFQYSLTEGATLKSVQGEVKAILAETGGKENLQDKLIQLKSIIADEALLAEQKRIDILNVVEQINDGHQAMITKRNKIQRSTILIGILTLVINLAVLYILTRVIVERPLYRLTTIIDEIRAGNNPNIPCQKRSDQIGVLAGAIKNFKEVLLEIQYEDERKLVEKEIIDKLIVLMSSVIHDLEKKSHELVESAQSLQNLAGTTKNQSTIVAETAKNTAADTIRASLATTELQNSTKGVTLQILTQNSLVHDISDSTRKSHKTIEQLSTATQAINSIVGMIRDLSDQTKVLALNATIEAARAGDKGKGFAVVAFEVKELSHETEKATMDIKNKLETISSSSQDMITILQDIDGQVRSLSEVTGSISNIINTQEESTQTISSLVGQTSHNTSDVSTNIQQVHDAAYDTLELSGKVHQHADSIAAELTQLLKETTGRLGQLKGLREPLAAV